MPAATDFDPPEYINDSLVDMQDADLHPAVVRANCIRMLVELACHGSYVPAGPMPLLGLIKDAETVAAFVLEGRS